MKNLSVILGGQWGDEGKGKLVDVLASEFDIVTRATGGANAGHTVYATLGDRVEKFVFHLLPSAIIHPAVTCVIGNGCVLHLQTLLEELNRLKERGISAYERLKISDRSALLFDYHKIIDGWEEDEKGTGKVGTTRRGIGPCYADKINRRGLRFCDLSDWDSFEARYRANLKWHQKMYGFEYDADQELQFLRDHRDALLSMICDSAHYLNQSLSKGKRVLVEGANAALLDIDHGTYPYVTSSNPTIGGVFTGTGMNPRHLGETIGIVKAYITRVGAGPFPTELNNPLGDSIREAGGEYGSTTGRPRRCGWFDIPLTRYSILLNGFTALNLTKLDVLDDLEKIQVAMAYRLRGVRLDHFPARLDDLAQIEIETITLPGWKTSLKDVSSWHELPRNAQNYVLALEEALDCPIRYIGVGQRRDQLIVRN